MSFVFVNDIMFLHHIDTAFPPIIISLSYLSISLFLFLQAARSIPRINKHLEDEAAEAANKVQMRLLALQDNIQNYREEYDFVVSFLS